MIFLSLHCEQKKMKFIIANIISHILLLVANIVNVFHFYCIVRDIL